MSASHVSRPAAFVLALCLSACTAHQALVPTSEASHVAKVDVRLASSVNSPTIAGAVGTKTRREATRYGRTGAAKELKISVQEVHYKNPVASLLIGDANYVRAHVTVVDTASGRPHGQFEADAFDRLALNGVVGAIVAAAQDKANVDQRLAESLASQVMERVYGTAAATEARKREPVEVVETPAAPAPDAAPGAQPKARPAPKSSVPVAARPAKAEPKTAMATGLAPAAAAR